MNLVNFILLFVLLSSVAWADIPDFTGKWRGPGRVQSTIGQNGNCKSIDIEIEQTPDLILVKKYDAKCGIMSSDWGPNRFEIKPDGKVFERGRETGTITEDTLTTIDPDSGVKYLFKLKLVRRGDGTVVLESTYGVENLLGKIDIIGTLSRIAR